MSLENSPRLDNPSKPVRNFSGWLQTLRPVLLALTALLVLFDIIFMVYKANPDRFRRAPGGMDGCVVTSGGAPVVATIWVGDISHPTDNDGCFFFAALNPGAQQLRVETSAGTLYKQTVTIKSGQAVGLGTLKIGP